MYECLFNKMHFLGEFAAKVQICSCNLLVYVV